MLIAIERSRRKSVGILIKCNGDVVVKAPVSISDKEISRIVESKRAWIEKKSVEASARSSALKDVSEYSECFYLGNKQKVLQHAANKTVFDAENSAVYVPAAKSAKIALTAWYKKLAKSLLKSRLDELSGMLGLVFNSFSLTGAKGKWGSCNAGGKITLNFRLVMLPTYLIDYVIVHELVHTKILNHSHEFWNNMKKIMPDCRQRAKMLKTHASLMEIYR